MKRLRPLAAAAGLAALAIPGGALAASVHMVVTPATVAPGAAVRVTATKSPCLPGDQITLISAAFPGHAFGEGAVYGTVEAHGAFSVRTGLAKGLRAGSYRVGGRCGGGNLGVTAGFRVR
jgi:hypothetical protein